MRGVQPTCVTGGRFCSSSVKSCFDMRGPSQQAQRATSLFKMLIGEYKHPLQPARFTRTLSDKVSYSEHVRSVLPSSLSSLSPLFNHMNEPAGSSLAPSPKVSFKNADEHIRSYIPFVCLCILLRNADITPACSFAFKTACIQCDSP